MVLDIKIMAIRSRRRNVLALCDSLGLNEQRDVFYDDRPGGGTAMYTAQWAWMLPHAMGVTHRLLLQDDVYVVPGLAEALRPIIEAHPNALISLYIGKGLAQYDLESKRAQNELLLLRMTKRKDSTSGQGLVLPIKFAMCFREWVEAVNPNYPHDDAAAFAYAESLGLERLVVYPNLVQCGNGMPSTLGHRVPKSKCFDWNAGSYVFRNKIVEITSPTYGKMITEWKEGDD